MEPVEIISRYAHDFGITKTQIEKCINQVSRKKIVGGPVVAKVVLEHIESLVAKCINKASRNDMKLYHYQELAVRHMLVNRGMIAAFDVGTGKTLTAVTIASCILNLAEFLGQNEIKVIVITPTSLQTNFKKEMKAYGSKIDDKYTFYTTKKFGIDYKAGLIDCSKTLFIVDESHVFRTDYRSVFAGYGAEKDTAGAKLALTCANKAWKVLLLTATPLYNREYDLVNLVGMVRGQLPPTDENPLDLHKRDRKLFEKMYGKIFLFQGSVVELFPRREDILVKIVMTPEYLKEYEELEENIKGNVKEGKEKATGAFFSSLRKASNKLNVCLKCDYAMDIVGRGEKTIIFSELKNFGVNILKEYLKKKKIKFYLIDGSTKPERRDTIVKGFNSKNGYKVLMITKAGGEGLDLKEVRNVILFEKGWNVAGEEQVIGRAVRLKSHKGLPDEKDHLVTVYHLVVVKPTGSKFMTIGKLNKDGKPEIEIPYLINRLKLHNINPSDYLSKFEKFVKEITINKEHSVEISASAAKKVGVRGENDMYGVEVYMFMNGLIKNNKIMKLGKLLKDIEINDDNIFDPFITADDLNKRSDMDSDDVEWTSPPRYLYLSDD